MRMIDADALRDNLQALAYDDWNQGVTTSWADAYSEVADMVEEMPTIEERKTGKWIPCSERLPDMHDEVLVTARGEVSIAWLYVDGKWRSNDMPQPMLRDIIAWMPLPEPWRGEER